LGIRVARDGAGYRFESRALDARSGAELAHLIERSADKNAVLGAIGAIAEGVRKALGDPSVSSLSGRVGETFTARSLEAAKAYADAQAMLDSGRTEESIAAYEHAIALDPDLGRAYAGAAVAADSLGRHADAERYFAQAMARVDRMTERERLRSRGAY